VLGVEPAAGRLLDANDAVAGAESVGVIGHRIWTRLFGADPAILGRRARIDGRPTTIVGVAPAGFEFPKGAEFWQALPAAPEVLTEGWFTLIGRLRPDATLAQASQESSVLLERLRTLALGPMPENLQAKVLPLREAVVGDARPVLVLFVASALILFMVGCFNVMNLLLVRGAARQGEMAVRAALGATRARLVGQIASEIVVSRRQAERLPYWSRSCCSAHSSPRRHQACRGSTKSASGAAC